MNKNQQITNAINTFYEKPIAKASLELFFSIGLVLFLAFFAIQPTLITMSDLVKEIDDKKALSENMSKKLAALSSAQVEYAAIRNQLTLLDQAIPIQTDIITILKTIEKIAADSQIIITSLAVVEMPATMPSDTDFSALERKSIPIRINVVGDYMSIRMFVENLISNRKVFVTDAITLSVSEKSTTKTLQATISITVPYYGARSAGDSNASN